MFWTSSLLICMMHGHTYIKNVALVSIVLLILLYKSLMYIKTNNGSPLERSRTAYRIILIIPVLVLIVSIVIWQSRIMVAFTSWIIMLLLSRRERPYFISFFIRTCGLSLILYRCFPRSARLCWLFWPGILLVLFPSLYIGSGARNSVYVFNHDVKLVSTSTFPVIV